MKSLAALGVLTLGVLAGCASTGSSAHAPRFIALSQHMGSDGAMWHRIEAGPMSKDECRALLKRVLTRPKIGFTKWYDVTPQMLATHFGVAATPDKGTWLACWAEGTDLGEPDS